MSSLIPPVLQGYIEQDALLVCIDVEAHCYNLSCRESQREGDTTDRRICEIGVCMLDTRDMVDTKDLGDRAFNLAQHFDVHEFAIRNAEHDNTRWRCKGSWCPVGRAENFLFGDVTWIWKRDIEKELVKLIRVKVGRSIEPNKDKQRRSNDTVSTYRPVIFLYFDCRNDVKWLREHNVDLPARFPNSEVIDVQRCDFTGVVAALLNRSRLGCRNLLTYLGLPSEKKHNGGNDSVFEMQAWLAGLSLTPRQLASLYAGQAIAPVLPRFWAKDFDWVEDHCARGIEVSSATLTRTPSPTRCEVFPALLSANQSTESHHTVCSSDVSDDASMLSQLTISSPAGSVSIGLVWTSTQVQVVAVSQNEAPDDGKHLTRGEKRCKKKRVPLEL